MTRAPIGPLPYIPSSSSLPAWDPLQAPYSKGRTKTEGWKRQLRLVLSPVVKKEEQQFHSVIAVYTLAFLCSFQSFVVAKLCWKKFSTLVTPPPLLSGRLVFPEELPQGEELVRGGRYVGKKSVGHVLAGCAGSLQPPGASATAERKAPRHMRSEVPRERLRFFSNPTMPPERRSRTRLDRRTGVRHNRKTPMKHDLRVGARPGGPPRKAAPSSQRKPPARSRAAAAAIAIVAAEERRLRQQNRLTLEEDKPAVERCLEELIFGDVEDSEDALLQRLRGPRVRESAARGLGALGRGAG